MNSFTMRYHVRFVSSKAGVSCEGGGGGGGGGESGNNKSRIDMKINVSGGSREARFS